jgi:NAD(P)-dependent dehydrogenase (short-subunit alcohol dehydrogenase family)
MHRARSGRARAQVALLARRRDRLEDAAREAGPGAIPIVCDVTDEQSCLTAVSEAATALGRINGLVYSTGAGVMAKLVDTDAATWSRLFATNVTGAALVTAAALPHLARARGAAVYLSSVSASLTPPWPMLGAYATTKAALYKLVEAWRGEYPEVGFTRLAVGDCGGGVGDGATEFAAAFDPDLFTEALNVWVARGYMNGGVIDEADLVHAVDAVLRNGSSSTVPSLTLAPRLPTPAEASLATHEGNVAG